MTINTTSNQTTIAGNGATTNFTFSFATSPLPGSDIDVYYTAPPVAPATAGVISLLPPSAYTLVLNAASGGIWGLGGTVIYNPNSVPIPAGSFLTIQRVLPIIQGTSISNQGASYPQAVETALDQITMICQQLAARTSQFRGVWVTGTSYVVGDIVQDGINGNNTGNWYICLVNNTSGVWATDLTAGDWGLSITAVIPTGNVTLTGAVTGAGPVGSSIATTIASSINLPGSPTTTTQAASDNSTKIATTAQVKAAIAADVPIATNSVAGLVIPDGAIITVDGSGHITVPSATSGVKGVVQVDGTTITASGGVISAVQPAAGAMILLGTVTANNSASVVFNSSLITATYSKYMITIEDLVAGSGSQLMECLVSTNNGGAYASANYMSTGGASTAFMDFFNGNAIPTSTNTVGAAKIMMFLGNGTSFTTFLYESLAGVSGSVYASGFTTYQGSSTVINNIKFQLQSGNISKGVFKLYGIL